MENYAFLRNNVNAILIRTIWACNVLIALFVAANLLTAWKLYAIPMDALQDFFTFGFALGGQKITSNNAPAGAPLPLSWGEIVGVPPGGKGPVGVAILQNQANPRYPDAGG